jgi:hypothetical protein
MQPLRHGRGDLGPENRRPRPIPARSGSRPVFSTLASTESLSQGQSGAQVDEFRSTPAARSGFPQLSRKMDLRPTMTRW